jgi:hypothetical protein
MSQHRSVGHKVGAPFIQHFTQFPRKLFGGSFGFAYGNLSKHPQVVHSGQLTRWLSNFANKYVYYNIYLPERQK